MSFVDIVTEIKHDREGEGHLMPAPPNAIVPHVVAPLADDPADLHSEDFRAPQPANAAYPQNTDYADAVAVFDIVSQRMAVEGIFVLAHTGKGAEFARTVNSGDDTSKAAFMPYNKLPKTQDFLIGQMDFQLKGKNDFHNAALMWKRIKDYGPVFALQMFEAEW